MFAPGAATLQAFLVADVDAMTRAIEIAAVWMRRRIASALNLRALPRLPDDHPVAIGVAAMTSAAQTGPTACIAW